MSGILAVTIFIGMFQVSLSGVQWPEDDSRYLNNGAMIREYLLSGEWFSPYEFAKKNYSQIPGFSVPYHPPGYAVMLGIWFIVFGMSYASGRLFIAAMLGITGIFFFRILRLQKVSWHVAFLSSILLITSHEMVHWGRSTMSEVPALAFIMIGSFFFLKWVDTGKNHLCWLAFGAALVAFFCRVTSAGVLPAWFLYVIFSKQWKRIFSFHIAAPTGIYLATGVFWSKFAGQFAKNEIRSGVADRLSSFATFDNLTVWLRELPGMIGPLTIIVAAAGFILLIKNKNEMARFWGLFLLSYYLFQVMLRIHFEARYFFFALPGFFAFICGIAPAAPKTWHQAGAGATAGAVLILNLIFFFNMPAGVTGHDDTAQKLSKLDLPGNILLSCWNDADLMFRYRCLPHKFERQLVRGDRTLAIRVSSYAGVDPEPVAQNVKDVENILKQGYIRYMVTSTATNSQWDDRHADMILAHETAVAQPELFTLLDKSMIVFDFSKKREAQVYIWQYEGNLPQTENRLPVIIPTADLKL